MKKTFITPAVNVAELKSADVIMASSEIAAENKVDYSKKIVDSSTGEFSIWKGLK